MRIGEIYRYARPYNPHEPVLDGMPNYFKLVFTPNCKLPLLESGINPIQEVNAIDGRRRPAILISSSPHKIGSEDTPWQDFFDPDNGHIRYYGDNKRPGSDPATSPGNRVLLDAFVKQSSLEFETRKKSPPIIFFKRVRHKQKAKGFILFQGFGVVERVQLVTQYDRTNKRSFPNYAFDLAVFDMSREFEEFSWEWVSARRNPDLDLVGTLLYAPQSWRRWVKEGQQAVNKCRRKVSKLSITDVKEQVPAKGSPEERVLRVIYNFYENRKVRFEALAALVAQRILHRTGGKYNFGWITQSGADSGVDFVGRLDLGSDFSRVKVVVLGQAKCEKLDAPTNGVHLARTVARLRRGWIGVYVTTSYFSASAQREVIEDQYPLLMVPGIRLAQETIELASEAGYGDPLDYLKYIDSQHDSWLQPRLPEEILLE
jgi:hypothetical protein